MLLSQTSRENWAQCCLCLKQGTPPETIIKKQDRQTAWCEILSRAELLPFIGLPPHCNPSTEIVVLLTCKL